MKKIAFLILVVFSITGVYAQSPKRVKSFSFKHNNGTYKVTKSFSYNDDGSLAEIKTVGPDYTSYEKYSRSGDKFFYKTDYKTETWIPDPVEQKATYKDEEGNISTMKFNNFKFSALYYYSTFWKKNELTAKWTWNGTGNILEISDANCTTKQKYTTTPYKCPSVDIMAVILAQAVGDNFVDWIPFIDWVHNGPEYIHIDPMTNLPQYINQGEVFEATFSNWVTDTEGYVTSVKIKTVASVMEEPDINNCTCTIVYE